VTTPSLLTVLGVIFAVRHYKNENEAGKWLWELGEEMAKARRRVGRGGNEGDLGGEKVKKVGKENVYLRIASQP
jgi:hypothetical protein